MILVVFAPNTGAEAFEKFDSGETSVASTMVGSSRMPKTDFIIASGFLGFDWRYGGGWKAESASSCERLRVVYSETCYIRVSKVP